MPGDYSRKIFNKKKHYRGVLMQQGRVQLDSDWNEQLSISEYRTQTEAIDVIGKNGVPKKDNGFQISIVPGGTDIQIAPGRIYVQGQLCELEDNAPAITTYFKQPYYPNPDRSLFLSSPVNSPLTSPSSPVDGVSALNLPDGAYILYLDAWQREINYLDDPLIHEVALGEADTTTRQQSVWQVKYLKVTVPETGEADCKTAYAEWASLIAPLTGKLNVQTNRSSADNNPCLLPPTSGYRRLENQLYRVEVQNVDNASNVSFKWSRDNGSVETTVADPASDISSSSITVTSIGKDSESGFAIGQWVEIIDDQSELSGKPNPLVKITDFVPSTRKLTFSASVDAYSSRKTVKLRRWDQEGPTALATGVAATSNWIDLEYGIQVNFTGGTYKPGDYWLIPGRTATGEVEWPPYEIPNLNPAEQLPIGVAHKFAKLALIKINGTASVLEDCRNLFPALTDLSAEDVSFDNSSCNLGDADNVQEALDLLCAANDLRLHHKLMHGYGVVCGLKVSCGFNRQQVNISGGYAIDCEGNIVQVKTSIPYSLIEQAAAANLLDATGSGTVLLSVSAKGSQAPAIALETYIKKSYWEEVLENSLLKDFYDDYILSLITFAKKQLSFSLTEQIPVPLEQRRLTAMINLFAQYINSASGSYAFISGQKGARDLTKNCGVNSDEKIYEDQLIWCFFSELRTLLSSSTFCAMYDQDKQFPDYTLDAGLDTIFGTPLKFHSKLKVGPGGQFAYTCGLGNHITVYDLKTNEAVDILTFPSTTNIQVLDIAIAADGKSLYAIGVIDDKDSYLAVAAIDANGKHTWSSTSPRCGRKIVTLGVRPNTGQLYAVSFNEGLYELTNIGTAAFACTPVREGFQPTGLLTFSDDGSFAFVAASTSGGTGFSTVFMFNITTPGVITGDGSFTFNGENNNNDILYFNKRIYITGTNPTGADILGGFDQNTGALLNPLVLEASSVFRMALLSVNNSFDLLITLADKFKVIRVSLNNPAGGGGFQLNAGFRIPVQLFPMGIVVNNATKKGYVLNTLVNTLTVFDIAAIFVSQPPDFTTNPPLELAYYRDDVLSAYKDIFKHLLEYLKDGFCEEFLIDCPQCTEANKVYLGSVEIRNRQVYHICNFSKRKYVKSFTSVEYWMSTIPILPIIKEAFIKFCCSVI